MLMENHHLKGFHQKFKDVSKYPCPKNHRINVKCSKFNLGKLFKTGCMDVFCSVSMSMPNQSTKARLLDHYTFP